MNTDNLTELLADLKKPFLPSQVTWKPGTPTPDLTKAFALAYADVRAYQNRLDEVCGLNWAVTYTPWGERIICHLTIAGVTRSSSGEPDSHAERAELAGTSAEAQAFKRACAMFGLGRYLYTLPPVWVAYDAATQQFTEAAKAKLEGILVQQYRRSLNQTEPQAQRVPTLPSATESINTEPASPHASDASLSNAETSVASSSDAEPVAREAASVPQSHPVTAEVAVPAPAPKNGTTMRARPSSLTPLQQQFDALGQELYGAQWAQVSRHNIERITSGQATESGALTAEQIQKLVEGMQKLQRKRRSAPASFEPAHAAA